MQVLFVIVVLTISGLATAGEINSPTVNSTESKPIIWDYPILPQKLFEGDNGQCVIYARALSGLDYSGHAYQWEVFINSQIPTLGSVVVFDTTISPNGHLGVVVAIYEDYFIISERNYNGPWVISERKVFSNDPSIVGFVKKVEPLQLEFSITIFANI